MKHFLQQAWLAISFVACIFAAGCDVGTSPDFRLNMVEAVSYETPHEYQQEIADVLRALFGTPDDPHVLPETELDPTRIKMSAGPAWTDEKGASFGLYRKHCSHCHGVTGDGRGPTAPFLNPYPRDYRPAVYKFKSTYNPARPTDDDLHRVLINGVPGTAMPSFALLPPSEVASLVEYVKYLSIRGQMETALIQYVYDELGEEEAEDENGEPILDDEGNPVMRRVPLDPSKDSDQQEAISGMLEEIVAGWQEADEQLIVPDKATLPAEKRTPEEFAASVEKGRLLFYTRADCVKCHGPTALGDGQQTDFDNWQKAHKKFLDETAQLRASMEKVPQDIAEIREKEQKGEISAEAANESIDELRAELEKNSARYAKRREVDESLYDVRNAIPRNLRQGIYRGGNRRIDLFHRIYTGIAGTPMPAGGPASPGAQGTLTEEEMWNLVDYIRSLPYEAPSRPQRALPENREEVF